MGRDLQDMNLGPSMWWNKGSHVGSFHRGLSRPPGCAPRLSDEPLPYLNEGPRTHLYIDSISAIMVSSVHGGVNKGSRSNSELFLRTQQRRLVPEAPALSEWIDAFSLPSSIGWYSGKMFLDGGIKGFSFFRQTRYGIVPSRSQEGSCGCVST